MVATNRSERRDTGVRCFSQACPPEPRERNARDENRGDEYHTGPEVPWGCGRMSGSRHVQAFAMVPQQAVMDQTLSHASLRALAVLAARRNSHHGWTNVCHAQLKADMGLSLRSNSSITDLIAPLVEKGYVEKVAGSGRSKSRYRIIYDRVSASDSALFENDDEDQEDNQPPEISGPSRQFQDDGSRSSQDATSGSDRDRTIILEQEDRTITLLRKVENAPAENSSAVEIWNEVCASTCGRMVKLTPARKAHLCARLRMECRGDIANWRTYCETIMASEFLTGGGNRGWTANFDWAVNPSNMVKVMEGQFRDRTSTRPGKGNAVIDFLDSNGIDTSTHFDQQNGTIINGTVSPNTDPNRQLMVGTAGGGLFG